MHYIFCLIGKSACGKDTVYRKLLKDPRLDLTRLVTSTTRPIREGEQDGREYHFRTVDQFRRSLEEGKVLEYRVYDTVHGKWYYYTEIDGQIDLDKASCLLIGTVEMFVSLQKYLGRDKVIPLYLEVEDGERLSRALRRERKQKEPKYAELCRRFLTDSRDFAPEKLREAGIDKIFDNSDSSACAEVIAAYILDCVSR